jgi:SAM-dependent methyltransferase
MYLDVAELRAFYSRPLGQAVRRLIGHRIRARWRHLDGQTLIGIGFATPYLGAFMGEAARVGAFMPAAQGALVWPREGATHCALVDETQLPLPGNCVDRLLAVHCIEGADATRHMLREMWRVLSPEGRLMLIVPNRRSVWARVDSTPFGHGRPYSRGQLERLLQGAMFNPTEWGWALHMPPVERKVVLRSAIAFERVGASVWPGIGGIMIVEARKELVAPTGLRQTARALGGLVTVRGR